MRYCLLSSTMAIGTVAGALVSYGRKQPCLPALLPGTATFGIGCTLAALVPTYGLFALALVVIEAAALTFTNTSNSLMRLAAEPVMRGRVMALRVGGALGGTSIGVPLVDWVADHADSRRALGVGATSGLEAALLALRQTIATRKS